MKTRILIVAALAIVALFVHAGCDTESADSAIHISPETATVSAYGATVQFVASGGYDYWWELSNTSRGRLSNVTGDTTVYTSLYDPGTNVWVQTIKVHSTIGGASDTNSVAYEETAQATITHL